MRILGAALLVLGCSANAATKCDLPDLTHETLSAVKDEFNRRVGEPRAIIFFSSGCAACDTGSAALQTMLEKLPEPVKIFAVWEPVMKTDPPPTSKLLANIKDPRVQQLWDPKHIMSTEMRLAELASASSPPQARTRTNNDPDGIMYDTMIVFAPGKGWEMTLPLPDYLEVGLEAKIDELSRELERAARAAGR